MLEILLIAGHGDGDPGAIGNGYHEADLTREMVSMVQKNLSKYANVTVFDTKKNPYKYFKANKFDFKKYGYVFEIHFNAAANDRGGDGKTTGTEILVHPTEKGISVEKTTLKNIEALGFRNRGVKTRNNLQNMNICKGSQNVSYALLETCFIDDKDDMDLYAKKKSAIALAVTEGIVEGFNLKLKEGEAVGFNDTKGHYAESAINELFSMGIVKGDENGNFRPNDNIKRADVAIMVRNAIRHITGK